MSNRTGVLECSFPADLWLFASPVYWPDRRSCEAMLAGVEASIRQQVGDAALGRVYQVYDQAPDAGPPGRFAWFLPTSGGVQPAMRDASARYEHVGLIHAYLEEGVAPQWAEALLHRNAHPASTDFYALRRRTGKGVCWIGDRNELQVVSTAWQATERLRHARLLRVGPTEPWVINSCTDPDQFKSRLGVEVLSLELADLYDAIHTVGESQARSLAADWETAAGGLREGVASPDIRQACRVTLGMRKLLEHHQADGLSVACFRMIGDLHTTSCLAVSEMNSSPQWIGACEGDLDAAVTMLLLKSLGADFVWIANPIIHRDYLDLVHCTAPRCAGSCTMPYQLRRHHESGQGVAPQVDLPAGRRVTLARIGDDLTRLVVHGGISQTPPRLQACHSQLRIRPDHPQDIIDTLLGTHLVLSFGDFGPALAHCGRWLGLQTHVAPMPPTFADHPAARAPAPVSHHSCGSCTCHA